MQFEIIQSLYILNMFCPTPEQGVSGAKAKYNAGNIEETRFTRKTIISAAPVWLINRGSQDIYLWIN